jgi:DNA uptake protein ComE-like DNA-binding protein
MMHQNQKRGQRRSNSQGFILAGVLVLVLLASMLVMSLLFRMHGEEGSMAAGKGAEQAWLACMSGVEEALRTLSTPTAGETHWRDNPGAFKEHFLYEDGSDRWYFTIYNKPDEDSLEPIRYGLVDEASKININTAAREILSKIPGMEPELVEALDKKEEPNLGYTADPLDEFFAELSTPSKSTRGFQSIAELLSIKGFSAHVIYGEDANFNLRLDPNEDDGNARPPMDNSDGRLDLGLSQYFTTSSVDPNIDNRGIRRTDINELTDPFPLIELPAALTNYIIAIRTNHLRVQHASDLLEATMKVKNEKGVETEIASGVSKAELAQALDLFTASKEPKQDGLVNVNTASVKVLAALPGLNDALAEAIISGRRSISPERRNTIAWIFEEGVLTTDQFKKVAPYLTARSYQFVFHVVGYCLPSGRYRVIEASIDTQGKGTVKAIRDLTRFGLPFNLEESTASPLASRGATPLSEGPDGYSRRAKRRARG